MQTSSKCSHLKNLHIWYEWIIESMLFFKGDSHNFEWFELEKKLIMHKIEKNMCYYSNEDSIKLSWAKCLLSNEKNYELRMRYEMN